MRVHNRPRAIAVALTVALTTVGFATAAHAVPSPLLTIDDVAAAETDGAMTFTISFVDATLETDITVDWSAIDVEATDGFDYEGGSGTATILAGQSSATVDVGVLDDAEYEGPETFTIELSNVSANAQIQDASGLGTLTDDDPIPTVSIADASVVEGNTGTRFLSFELTLSNPSALPIDVDVATTDGTATAGVDHTPLTTTVTFGRGATSKFAKASVIGDTVDEPDETFRATVSNPVGDVTLGTTVATGTITDDDKTPTALTLKAAKRAKIVRASGLLEPAVTGLKITVTLSRKVNGNWTKVRSRTVTVSGIADRDGDTVADATYLASFTRPATKGTYRFEASFAGNATFLPSTSIATFTI
jgi:hypothetical protein